MKKIGLLTAGLFLIMSAVNAQQSLNESPNFKRYAQDNKQLPTPENGEKRVVFIGNSITDDWSNMSPEFFNDNNYIGRGISGQTSPQLLMRFQQDVIQLKPVAVVINIGTNDIAKNTGVYNPQFTLDNIKSMAEIAEANGIKVILTSVLPVGKYPWRAEVENVPAIIDALNENIKRYAVSKGFTYADYNTPMRDTNGAMKEVLAWDGVHPTKEGYILMEAIIKPIIDEVVKP